MINMELNKLKERLLHAIEICSECDTYDEDENKKCNEIPISRKIWIGCGKWKANNEWIINQEVYDQLKNLTVMRSVVSDILSADKDKG
jgi:hypothetical protein